jgi:outer membrane protein, multidrug efflux system
MIRYALPTILLVFSLAGCISMAPEYTRPAPPVPAQWPDGPAYKGAADAQTGAAADGMEWRKFYKDEKLQKLIALALDNNRDLRVATLNIEKAQALYRIQRAALFPAVNASGAGAEQQTPADLSYTGQSVVTRQWSVTVGVSSYELDFWGRITSLKDQALEQYLATEQARRSAQISLVAEVAYAYLTRAADCERLKVSRDTLESQEASYKLIERKFNVGSSSALDLSQAKTRVDAARVDIALYTGQVAQDENALALLVGAPVPTELLSNVLDTAAMFNDTAAGVSSEALLRRPDIEQAEHLLKAFNANIGAARAAFFPTIVLTTSAGTLSSQVSGLFTAGQNTWTFVPQLTLPIFDAGSRWANLAAAKTDRDIYLARYEKAIQTAFKEVADALAVRGTVGDQMTAQESLVKASEEAYNLSDLRYTKGIDNYLGVLDAQRSLFAARLRLISIRQSQVANMVTVYKVLGGGEGK